MIFCWMENPSRLLAERCILQGYQKNIGATAFKWLKQWDAIRLRSISFGIIMKQHQAFLILKRQTGTWQPLSGSVRRKVCGSCCDRVLMYVPNGILGGYLPTS